MYTYTRTHVHTHFCLPIRLLRVVVTPAVDHYLFEFLHVDIQSTGQKSHCVNTLFEPSQCFVLIKQLDSPCPLQFHRATWVAVEPIFFPKLQIYFADFPYLHYSINEIFFKLETWCGYEYEPWFQSISSLSDFYESFCKFPSKNTILHV